MIPKPPAEFSASPCYSDDTGDERECTEAELAQQRKDFDAAQAESKAEPLKPTYTPKPALPDRTKKSLREVKEAILNFFMKLQKDGLFAAARCETPGTSARYGNKILY